MEELSKVQLILLALFVSFVTSIATGIVTVTLMDQAPPGVTQTINRVVERTIERVVPEPQPALVKEVLVSSDDLIVKAILQASPSVVSFSLGDEPFASGFVVAPSIVATFGAFPEVDLSAVVVVSGDGKRFTIEPLFTSPYVATYRLSGVGAEKLPVLALSKVGGSLGRTIAALSLGKESDPGVTLGVITAMRTGTASTTPLIQTNLSVSQVGVGGPVIDTKGAVLGIVAGESAVVPTELIRKALDFSSKNQ